MVDANRSQAQNVSESVCSRFFCKYFLSGSLGRCIGKEQCLLAVNKHRHFVCENFARRTETENVLLSPFPDRLIDDLQSNFAPEERSEVLSVAGAFCRPNASFAGIVLNRHWMRRTKQIEKCFRVPTHAEQPTSSCNRRKSQRARMQMRDDFV